MFNKDRKEKILELFKLEILFNINCARSFLHCSLENCNAKSVLSCGKLKNQAKESENQRGKKLCRSHEGKI